MGVALVSITVVIGRLVYAANAPSAAVQEPSYQQQSLPSEALQREDLLHEQLSQKLLQTQQRDGQLPALSWELASQWRQSQQQDEAALAALCQQARAQIEGRS